MFHRVHDISYSRDGAAGKPGLECEVLGHIDCYTESDDLGGREMVLENVERGG